MRLNSKVTWGLAWIGLAVVLAVPSADFLTGKMGGGNKAAVLTSDTDPVKTASVTTTITDKGVLITPVGRPGANPVDNILNKGKKLPDYISDNAASSQPVAPVKSAGPTQVASIDPVAPTPFPSWARPVPVIASTMTKPTVAQPTVVEPTVIEAPVIVDEQALVTQDASIQTAPRPPASIVDDSANWDSESLRQYLERRGLLEGNTPQRSSASVTVVDPPSGSYDPDGFFLSDGPNDARARRAARLRRLFGEGYVEGDSTDFTPF